MSDSFLDLSLKEFLDAVPARTPAPGGGAVAAVVAALAAGLAAMAARFAPDEWERRADAVGEAEALRARLEPLADADTRAYEAFVADRTDETRRRIVEIPLEIAAAAAAVAELAAEVAADGNPNVRGDAAAAADLAAAPAFTCTSRAGADAETARGHAGVAAAAASRAAAADD